MGNVYVDWANQGGTENGSAWATAYGTLAEGLAAAAPGDDIWVAHNHSETLALAATLTSTGTAALPCRVMCADKAGSVPPVAADLRTTGIVATTGANHINFMGVAYCYGLTFSAGDSANAASVRWPTSGYWRHKNCKFILNNSSSSSSFFPASGPAVRTEWEDCVVKYGAVAQVIQPLGGFLWHATAGGSAIDAAGSVPTNLFGNSASGFIRLRGLDLSLLTNTKTIVVTSTIGGLNVLVSNCRFGDATAGTKIGAPSHVACENLVMTRVERTGLNYTFDKGSYSGAESAEITIVRATGATDGVVPIAKKIVCTAHAEITGPFEALPIAVWNEDIGAPIDVTIECTQGSSHSPSAVAENDEIWMEVEYLASASYPLSFVESTAPATLLTTPTAYAAGSGTWGGGSHPFAMTVTITPEMAGFIVVRVKAALASATYYIDPEVVLS